MPKKVKANGKTFTFEDDVTNEQIGIAIDEYFAGVKKKVATQPTAQKKQLVSPTQQKPTPTSSDTEETQPPVESDGLGGPPKMKTFTGFTPEEQQTLQAKPVPKISKSAALISKKLRPNAQELATVKVTPENQEEILRKTDELSAAIKDQDRLSQINFSKLDSEMNIAAARDEAKEIAKVRLNDALTNTGIWNNVKAASIDMYNAVLDQPALRVIGVDKLKVDADVLSDEKKEALKEAAKNKIKLSDAELEERAKELYIDRQSDYIVRDNLSSFLDNLDEKDQNLLKQNRRNRGEHLQESNVKEEKVINAYEVIANKKINEYKAIEQELFKYKNNNQPLPRDMYDAYVSLGNEIVGIGNSIQKRQSIIDNNREDLGNVRQEFDLLKRRYGDIDNAVTNIGLGGTKILNGILGFTNYAAKFAGGAQGQIYSLAGQQVTDKISDYIVDEESQLRKPVESIESPEGFVNYVSDIISKQIPNLVATSTGIGGLGVIGVSSTGEKYTEMTREVLEGKATYSPLQMAVAPALWGSAEVISEIPTASILFKGKRLIDAIVKNEGDLIKKSVKEKAKEWAKDWSVDMSKEITGEEFTNFTQNFTNKYILGKKDVGLLDNAGTVLKDTFTLTNILKAAPHVAGAVLKSHQNNSDLNILDENSKKIIDFSKQLENELLNDTEIAVINKQIDKATAQNSKIIANTIEKVNNMPDDVYRKIIDLNNNIADIKIEAVSINDGNLPNKAELIKSLESDYRTAQTERNALIDAKYESPLQKSFNKLENNEKIKLKDQASRILMEEAKSKGLKNFEFNDQAITDKAVELFKQTVSEVAPTEVAVTEELKPTEINSNEAADVEAKRQKDLKKYDERDKKSIEQITPKNPNHKILQVGQKWDMGYNAEVQTVIDERTTDGEGVEVVTKVIEAGAEDENGKMTKIPIVEVAVFDNKEQADKYIEEKYNKIKKTIEEQKSQKKVNAKYDSELKALEKPAEAVAEEVVTEEPRIKDSQIPLKRETFEVLDMNDEPITVEVVTRKDGSRRFTQKVDGDFAGSTDLNKDNTLSTEEYVNGAYGDIQGETKVEQGIDIMAPAMKDKLTAQQKEELGITEAPTTKVISPEIVTEEVEPAPSLAKEYIQSIEKSKSEAPEKFWSVDRPFQKEDGTIDEVQLDKAAEEGRIIKTESGFGVVGEDGDIKGVFKADLKSTEKTGDKVIQEAVKKGGIKLDNFALPNLMKIYERNGFREVSRLPFNEEYAPEGWTPEQGTPDVVAMVYDPNEELNIEKKSFTDYDEAMSYRDSYVKQKPTVKSKLAAFKTKYIDKPVYDRTKLDTQVENAKKSLSKLLPNVKFVVHDTKESFIGVSGRNARGYYDPATKTIHINSLEANARTVAHEVFHSVLLDKVKTDANARDLTKRMISAISKTLEGNPDLKKNLDDFVKNYDENIKNEEKVAELFGYLADGYSGFDAPTKSVIKRAMDRLAKMFGLKPFTEEDIVDMLKTLSGKVATGEEIVSKDVEIFKGGKKVDTPSDGLTKKFQYGNDKVNLEIKYLEQDRIDELKQSGLLTEPENLSELNGKRVVTTSPDDMLVGSILVNGKEVAVGNGGVYFVTKFGDVWANSNKKVANGLANAINETYDPETGKSYLALVKGTDAKLVSSPQGVTSSLAVTESMIDAGLFSLSDFRSAVRSAVKSSGGSISLSPNGSAKVLKSEVDDFFKDVTSSTFEKRCNVLRDIVSNLAKSESAKNNKNEIISFLDGDKNKGLGVGKTEKSQSLIDLIAKTSAEKITKGLNTGDVYAVIEIDGKVKVVQDSHQSYPYHIKIVDENGNVSTKKPVLILPKTRSNGKEILTSLEGKTAKELGTAFSGRVGATANMPYGKGIIMDNPKGRLQETEDYSDMKDIVKDMIDDGMSITEIKKVIGTELGTDQVSLAERAYNELTEEAVAKEPTGSTEAFRDKVKDIPESGKVSKYLSGETIERVEGEAPRNIQEIDVMPLVEAGMHGKETVAMAKEVYGDKYIEKTLEFLDTANLKAHEKALLYVSLENEMFDLVNSEPNNVGLKKLQDLVRTKSQQFLRESSLAINMGRLRAIMKDGFNYESITDGFLSTDQLIGKKEVEKAIQSDANAIQKEYEEQIVYTQEQLDIEIQKVREELMVAPKENVGSKARKLAKDIRSGKKAILPSWAVAEGAKGAKGQGLTFEKTFAKALETFADVHDATKDFAKAIDEGLKVLKQWYTKNNVDFNEDDIKGKFSEYVKPTKKELTNKQIVNQALIDAGFGREISVKGVKRNVLDWKKLAGEEGSVDKLKENVEKIIGKEAAKELEDEYNNLRASIIEKSLNELERRNIPRKKVNLKTSAKKLAEIYNYGLFEKESDTYDQVMNTVLGMNELDQKSFNEAKKLAKSLSELFSQKDSEGNPISQESLKHGERVINKKIERLLSKVAWSESNGLYKAVTIAKEFIGAAQRNALVSVGQAIENTMSGYVSRIYNKIGFSIDNVDTKSLKESRNKLARMTFKDIVLGGGLEFGDVTSPFITKSKTMDLIQNASDSRLYHALTSTALGKPFLEAADSMHKSALTAKFFQYNLIKILRQKGYSKTEAKNYVSEQLTGQSFEDALVTSKEIIDEINKNAGKKVIPDSEESIYRFANDLINESLIQGEKINIDEIRAALKAAETVAGFELGHEPNNIVSKPINLFNSWIQTRIDKAVKDKKWNDAATLTAASILSQNILNPYVGGGMNWTFIGMQKVGIPTLATIRWNIKARSNKLDVSSEQGMKNLEETLKYQLLAKNANTRVVIGSAISLAAFALANATGADDDLYEWLKKNAWAKKYFAKVSPPVVQYMVAEKDKKISEFFGKQLNLKVDAFDEGKKIKQAIDNISSGKTQKALGGAGQLAGSRLSTPIIPWRMVRDVSDIYRGLNGLPAIKHEYKASGFASGYFQGGMVEQLGLRPEDVKDVSGGRESSGSRSESGSRESSGTRTQSGNR